MSNCTHRWSDWFVCVNRTQDYRICYQCQKREERSVVSPAFMLGPAAKPERCKPKSIASIAAEPTAAGTVRILIQLDNADVWIDMDARTATDFEWTLRSAVSSIRSSPGQKAQ